MEFWSRSKLFVNLGQMRQFPALATASPPPPKEKKVKKLKLFSERFDFFFFHLNVKPELFFLTHFFTGGGQNSKPSYPFWIINPAIFFVSSKTNFFGLFAWIQSLPPRIFLNLNKFWNVSLVSF